MNDSRNDSVQVTDLMERSITYFETVRATAPTRDVHIRALLAAIRDGRWSAPVAAVRNALTTQGKKAADALKCQNLPAVTFSGTFDQRSKSGLRSHSGVLVLDFDSLADRLESARQSLITDAYVWAVFTSPSGNGLKALVAISATSDGHAQAFETAAAHFARVGLVADPSGNDVSRLCFLSHDPKAWVRAGGSVVILSAPCTICTPAPTAKSASSGTSTPSAKSAPSGTSAPSARHAEVLERRLQRQALDRAFEATPRLARIFRNFVESRPALSGQRNVTITKIVPSLYSVVADGVALQLSLVWFDMNRAVFKDTREQHTRETEAMLRGFAKTYEEAIPAETRSVYAILDVREQAAFRVCRDLAARGDGQKFFLSCDELGERLGCNSRQAHRILSGFVGDGLLQRTTLGQARAPGVRPLATEWKWLLE